MDHLLICTCKKEHVVSRSQAGQEILCECGNSVRIPTLRGLSQLPAANDVPLENASTNVWGGWRGPAIAVCSAVFAISAGFSSFFFLQKASIRPTNDLESEIAAGNEVLDQYGPDALSMVWNDLDTFGMGAKARPGFYIWQEYARGFARNATITGAIAAVFGVLSLGIWISALGKN